MTFELFSKLSGYLSGGISLRELEEGLVPLLPILLRSRTSQEARITGAIELYLAEFSAGIRTERSVRQALRKIERETGVLSLVYPVSGSYQFATTADSNSSDVTFESPQSRPSWSSEPQVEFV